MRSSRYGNNMANFERDLEHEAWMRRRLQEAVDKLADESADKLGRLMGYTNGGFVREILKGTKPVGKAIVTRINRVPGGLDWFKTDEEKALEEAKGRVGKEMSTEGVPPGTSPQALNLARRFDALVDAENRELAFAALDSLLRSFERVQGVQLPSPAAGRASGRGTSHPRGSGR